MPPDTISFFQEKLREEFDQALVPYLLLFKNLDILKGLQDRQLAIIFVKSYFVSCFSVLTLVSLGGYYFHDAPFLAPWIGAVILYSILAYTTNLMTAEIFPDDNKAQLLASLGGLLVSSFIFMLSLNNNIGVFMLLLVALDYKLARPLASTLTDTLAMFYGNQNSKWLRQATFANSNQILARPTAFVQELEAGNQNSDTPELRLPSHYTGTAQQLAENLHITVKRELCSLEQVFVNTLNAVPWKEQLSLRLTLKLFTNEAIAEVFVKQLIVDFYRQNEASFDTNDIEGRDDYLYSICLANHALLPTYFTANNDAPFLSNAVDDAEFYDRVRGNSTNNLHAKKQTAISSIQNIRVAEDEFIRLHSLITGCAKTFFAPKESTHASNAGEKKQRLD
ncbi:MAG: hypothetical protein LRY69_02465 [Gammaproteobacteria bacterium]|nr:hypothetical protein [Gammaproteobacteria bacterium]